MLADGTHARERLVRWLSAGLLVISGCTALDTADLEGRDARVDPPAGSPGIPPLAPGNRPENGVAPAVDPAANAQNIALYNHSGCDSPVSASSCTPAGGCCDTHDACIAANCEPGCGDARSCQIDFFGGSAECRPGGAKHNAACCDCHSVVMGCFGECLGDDPPESCKPADCCADGTCGCPQQCFDEANNKPIYDACACDALGLGHPGACNAACTQNGIKGCGKEFQGCTDDCPCAPGFCCDNYTCLPCGGTGGAGGGGGAGGEGATGTGGYGTGGYGTTSAGGYGTGGYGTTSAGGYGGYGTGGYGTTSAGGP